MADPLSILGAVAAASQLLEQGADLTKFLWELYSKMKNAPESIRKQIVQVEQLLGLSRLFLQNSSLQKDYVASILGTCILRAQEFHSFLKKMSVVDTDGRFKKIKKSFEVVMKEKEIVVLLDHLEREKTSLMLCIQEVDSKLLNTIGIEIKDMKTGLDDMAHVINDTAHNLTQVVSILPDMSAKVTEIHTVVKSLQTLTLDQQAFSGSLRPPSHAKSYSLIPNRRVRGFIGREDVITRIESGFSSGPGPRIVVIRGMGGQGKTQVALEYCRRAKDNAVRAIFWVDANSETSVKQSFGIISENIGVSVVAGQTDERVRLVMEKLEEWPDDWIMVFDNYDDPSAFNLQEFIPQGETGCILVTSRHADTDCLTDPENVIELQGLPEKDCVELLFKQIRAKGTDSDLQHGKQIIERLGYHPLAITQAGSYVYLRKIELHQFMDYYKRQRKAILDQTSQMIQYKRKLTDEAKETALNVFTTWELSFQQLQTKSTESNSEDLMTLFAFFDCKDISDQLFGTYREAKGIKIESSGAGQSLSSFLDIKKCWDQEKFITVLIVLTQMSLVQAWSRDEQGFCHLTLHPLVKDWIRLRTIITAFCDYARKAANILLATLQTSYHDSQFQFSFADRQRMLSHLDTYNENLEFMEAESQPEIFRYFYRDFFLFDEWASDFLSQSGLHAEAEVMCRREVAWCESEFGKEDVRTLSSLHSLACIFENHGKSEEAEEIFRHVILGQEKTLGAEHRDTLRSLYNRATSLRVLGRPGEAEELYRRVHQAREKVLGPDHAETLQSLNGLGKSLAKQGRYKEAEKIQRRLVQVREIQAPQYTSTFYSQWTLGFTLRQQGSYEEAAEYYSRAASSFEKVFGANHPDAIRCRKDYLALLEAMGRSDSSRL